MQVSIVRLDKGNSSPMPHALDARRVTALRLAFGVLDTVVTVLSGRVFKGAVSGDGAASR